MREIKFRAWCKNEYDKKGNIETFRMIEWNQEFFYDTSPVTYYTGEFPAPDDPDIILMQYTGLHDKNGKEIYEGDIIQMGEAVPHIGEVVFHHGGFKMRGETAFISFIQTANMETSKIIGNIYENPELLETQ